MEKEKKNLGGGEGGVCWIKKGKIQDKTRLRLEKNLGLQKGNATGFCFFFF